jgi:hypothetical protein
MADTGAMFIRYFLELPMPRLRVVQALTPDPQAWLPEIAQGATLRADAMLAEAGAVVGSTVPQRVVLEFGAPSHLRQKTILPMRWLPGADTGPFPALDADVEIAGLGPERTQLAISARLASATSPAEHAIDRGLLFRVAEATLKDFLDQVGDEVMASVTAA